MHDGSRKIVRYATRTVAATQKTGLRKRPAFGNGDEFELEKEKLAQYQYPDK
jgi:hypothetical protein